MRHAHPERQDGEELPRYVKQRRAHRAVAAAVASGQLNRRPCEEQVETGAECGREPTDAHHDDYDEPLGVRWLCRTHHRLAHSDVKPVSVARPGSLVSLRRFRNDPQVLNEPVKVMRQRDGHREFVGIWIPAWAVEEGES